MGIRVIGGYAGRRDVEPKRGLEFPLSRWPHRARSAVQEWRVRRRQAAQAEEMEARVKRKNDFVIGDPLRGTLWKPLLFTIGPTWAIIVGVLLGFMLSDLSQTFIK